jgi:hypothetical protein
MVQRAAGQEVPGVVVGHVPHRLGVVAEGVRAPGLLEAPQLDAAVAGRRRQKVAAAGRGQDCQDSANRQLLSQSRIVRLLGGAGVEVWCTGTSSKLHSLMLQSPEEDAKRLPLQENVKVFETFF